jgi:hypothetical protein
MEEEKITQGFFKKISTFFRKTFRVFKFFSAIVLVIVISVILFNYQTETRQKNKIEIIIKPSEKCDKQYPIAIGVINKSSRTIEKITIYPKAQKEGYSTNLAGYNSIDNDKIIKPNEGNVVCYTGRLDYGNQEKYKPEDLVWGVDHFYVDFEKLWIEKIFD